MSDERGTTVVIGDLEIEPVERTVVRVESVGLGIVGLATKRPIAVVVRSAAGTFRFDLDDIGEAAGGGDAEWFSVS